VAPGDDGPPLPESGLDTDDARLTRAGGERGPSLAEAVAARGRRALYRSPLHAMRLRGRFPLKLLGVPADPVPGDPALGERLIAGRMIHAGHTAMTRDLDFAAPSHPAEWRAYAHGWGWLRHLAAAAPDREAGAKIAEPLVARWLAQFDAFEAEAWAPGPTGRRILMAAAHAPLVLSSRDQVYRSALLNGLGRWARHLDRAAFRLPDGIDKAAALTGLYAAGLLIPGGTARAEAAVASLAVLMETLVLPDGGIGTRAPIDGIDLAELLLFAEAAAKTAGIRAPVAIVEALQRLVPHLRGLALGDGHIGAWGGGTVIPKARLDRTAKLAGVPGLAKAGRWSGYNRLAAGKTVLVIDAGPPPLARLANGGHAQTLAFEMSDGADRLIVNCGGARGATAALPPALAAGLRTTAAHSTLVVADTNSTRILDGGGLGKGVAEVISKRQESEEGQWLEASHDGYVRRYGLLHLRRLYLSPTGTDLRGEDRLEPVGQGLTRSRSTRFDLRFHLGPGVEATQTADGAGALLKLPQGRVWAFKAVGGTVAIEPSLFIDAEGALHRTAQLVISGETTKRHAAIAWSLKRSGR
jgi:uncharacterized heparinase superfamily protein